MKITLYSLQGRVILLEKQTSFKGTIVSITMSMVHFFFTFTMISEYEVLSSLIFTHVTLESGRIYPQFGQENPQDGHIHCRSTHICFCSKGKCLHHCLQLCCCCCTLPQKNRSIWPLCPYCDLMMHKRVVCI